MWQRFWRALRGAGWVGDHGRHARLLKSIERTELLILDDWGLSISTAIERRTLLEILEDRQGRGFTIVTSQRPFDQWHETIGDPTLADAILDRLGHNAQSYALCGESMRRKMSSTNLLDQATNTDSIKLVETAAHDRVK